MNVKEEGSLQDYIVVGVIGFAIGTAIASIGGFDVFSFFSRFVAIDWGRLAAQDVVSGIFAYLPGGFIAGFLSYRLHKTENKMEGFTAGFMTFLAHLFITLLMTILRTAIGSGDLGVAMQTWALSLVFALIFYPIGGYLAGMIEGRKIPVPSFLRFQFRVGAPPSPPPPPPSGTSTCPTCGGPLTYVQQYQRWYCYKCQKYT